MTRRQLTHLKGPDVLTQIWFKGPGLGGLSHLIPDRSVFGFDFSRLGQRTEGHLSMPNCAKPGESVEASVWLEGWTRTQQSKLKVGEPFNVLERAKTGARVGRRVIGLGRVKEVLESQFYSYEADAEVEVKFVAGFDVESAMAGLVLRFHFRSQAKTWEGHLDGKERKPGHGWQLAAGNSYLCLHSLSLSSKNHSPGGQPFSEDDIFEVSLVGTGGIGQGRIVRLIDYGKQKVDVCEPSVSGEDVHD